MLSNITNHHRTYLRWVTSPDGERPNGPGRFIYDIFGQGGYRVFMGVLGVVIIACGIFFLFVGR